MHPKRFRQRIEKAERILFSRIQGEQYVPINSNSQLESRQFSYSNELHKSILEVASKIQSLTKQSTLINYSQQMEPRDHYIIMEAPKLQQEKGLRQKQIKIWLGEVCRYVFSISYNNFSTKVFDTQTMQSFTCECMIGNVIELSKINTLSQDDFQLINSHLRMQILPYFLLRYPQSNNKQVNQKLNKEVAATDYLDTNLNNMIIKSKVKFQYRQNGIYYDKIMQFINYLQQLPEKKLIEQEFQTMFEDFNQRMDKLFTSVYNRKWTQTDLYSYYNSSDQTVDMLRQKVHTLQSQVQRKQIKSLQQIRQPQKVMTQSGKNYADIVKQYTKFAINRKISENVPKYTQEQIKHSNIKIMNPSILRIIVKWCTELQQKFQNDYFIQRSDPFVMDNGDEVEMNQQFRGKLRSYAAAEWKKIQIFLKQIQSNIYQKQAELSFNNLMYYSTQKLPQYEQSIIKFANRNTDDVNHYAICYLNRLIHGLITISKKIFQQHLNGWAQWPYPPALLTFLISDLIRCKCFSKQKEIIRIYKQLQIQSQINPDIIKIVKAKNRLNRGTKDILLNVLFHKQALCQIQLAIKVDQSQFSLWSDKFNHYIYQLQRSTYGPVTQMCSIWSSLDERSSLLKNQKIRIPEYNHACQTQQLVSQILPFTCSLCYKHYSQSRYIYDHTKCSKCQKFWTCALCTINTMKQQLLISQLQSKNYTIDITKRILQTSIDFPEYFVGFLIESLLPIGQKFRKYNFDNLTIFARLEQGTIKVIQFKKNDKKEKKKLFQNYIFFLQSKADTQLSKISTQQVIDQTVLAQISECYKKKSQSLRISGKNVTKQLLLKINDGRAQNNISTLSLPQNLIDSIVNIGQKFINVKILNLNNNKISSLEGLGKMKLLTDLYMGENRFKQIVQLDNLVHLKYAQFGDNSNSPQFKCNLSKLTKLQSLTLIRSNLLQFPLEVCKLQNLKLLWLFENQIKRLPSEISSLRNLQFLHLEMNQIETLPSQLFNLNKLIKLMLSYNKIQQIPKQISKLRHLELFSIQNNPLKALPVEQLVGLITLKCLRLNAELEPLFIGRQLTALSFK